MRFQILAAFLSALPFLTSCDSADHASSQIVGEWKVVSSGGRQIGRVNQQQLILDTSQPATVSLSLTGDVTDAIRFASGFSETGDGSTPDISASAVSYDPADERPDQYTTVTFQTGDEFSIRVNAHYGNQSSGWYGISGSGPFTPFSISESGYTFTTSNLEIGELRGHRSTTMDGLISLPTKQIETNSEFIIHERTNPQIGKFYNFKPNGYFIFTYKSDTTVLYEHTGTWEDSDGVIRTTVPNTVGPAEIKQFSVERDGDHILLVLINDTPNCDTRCLRETEITQAIETGTLISAEFQEITRLRPMYF